MTTEENDAFLNNDPSTWITPQARSGHIPLAAEAWIAEGDWQILIRAPMWVINAMAHQFPRTKFAAANFGGTSTGGSILLVLERWQEPANDEPGIEDPVR
jgi:hypothetical protein